MVTKGSERVLDVEGYLRLAMIRPDDYGLRGVIVEAFACGWDNGWNAAQREFKARGPFHTLLTPEAKTVEL